MSEENQTVETENNPDELPQMGRSGEKKRSWMGRYVALSTIVVIGLGVYLAFFSETSVVRGIAYKKTIDSLQACIAEQEDSLEYSRLLNRRLSTDPSLTEQVVREQYNMKRDNEDVFVFQ